MKEVYIAWVCNIKENTCTKREVVGVFENPVEAYTRAVEFISLKEANGNTYRPFVVPGDYYPDEGLIDGVSCEETVLDFE
jgi:hypothetical protein